MDVNKGVVAVFLGPDGSGKSTVIRRVESALCSEFDEILTLHLFPGPHDREQGVPVTDPHGKTPRRFLDSYPKMALWFWRYSVGYLRYIRPELRQTSAILFDRYFPDIIVDPKRYRYGGPHWLPRLMWKVLPKPDLIILLDAPAEVLQRRKQEVPFEETERQTQAYRELVADMTNGHIVDASKPVEDVVASVGEAIMDFKAARTQKRMRFGGQ